MENKKLVEDIENKNLVVKYLNEPVQIDDNMKTEIEKYWYKVKDKFTRGRIFAIKDIKEENNNINIEIYHSDYAHFIYSKRHDMEMDKKCKNIWAGILIETLDNKYVFGRMSEITATTGEYHISGGSCDEKDIENGYMNCEKTMYRELKEELNLVKEDFKYCKMKYLKFESKREADIGVLYKGLLNKTSEDLQNEYNKYLKFLKETDGEIEFTNLQFVNKDKDSIEEFVKNNTDYLMEFTEEILLYDLEN